MLKITAIGNLTHDVELKMNENTGKPYATIGLVNRLWVFWNGWSTPAVPAISKPIPSPIS